MMTYVSNLVGVILYNMFIKSWTYRKILIVQISLYCTLMFLQFTFVMRWNLLFGIPDIAMAISLNIFKPLKNVTI